MPTCKKIAPTFSRLLTSGCCTIPQYSEGIDKNAGCDNELVTDPDVDNLGEFSGDFLMGGENRI